MSLVLELRESRRPGLPGVRGGSFGFAFCIETPHKGAGEPDPCSPRTSPLRAPRLQPRQRRETLSLGPLGGTTHSRHIPQVGPSCKGENTVGPRPGASRCLDSWGLAPPRSPPPRTPHPRGPGRGGDPFGRPVPEGRTRPGWTLGTSKVSQKVSAVALIQGSFWKRDDLNSSLARSPTRELQTGSRRPRPPPPPRPPAGWTRPPFTPAPSAAPTCARGRDHVEVPGEAGHLGARPRERARGGGQPLTPGALCDARDPWGWGAVGDGRGWSRRGGAGPRGAGPGRPPPPTRVP